ncbi:MAG TPA: lipase maturation factor family protein [Polyangiaceae bacterium]|nr:lipase maturation factor family protein [Polyangiaceae bacterium]
MSDGEGLDGGGAVEANPFRARTLWNERCEYAFTRGAILRGLGFIYAVAFLILFRQMNGLISSHGLLPVAPFLSSMKSALGASAYVRLPTLFWFGSSDAAMRVACSLGLALSVAVMAGFANAATMGLLWLLDLSFVGVGQTFYGFGWEMLLLEAGFLAIFLAPSWPLGSSRGAAPEPVIWLYRWLLFRVMFGAGLIKLRGDPCWVELTCLADFYETQPIPGPLSSYFHAMPMWFHEGGALFNHFVELIVPWGAFGPKRVRRAAGALTIVFQSILIASGNLAFLNWLTIVVALACFDDEVFVRAFPRRLIDRLRAREGTSPPSLLRRRTIAVLCIVVAALSIAPTVNLLSSEQRMNDSFDPFHLVNTYGAFGSVEHERHEVVIEGTWDDPLSGDAHYQEYEFPCKPGDPKRRPCFVTPYHYRLDWQMWFLAIGGIEREPWFLKLVYELLRENPAVTGLLAKDPFAGRPPRYLRALYYRYQFTRDRRDGVWKRTLLGEFLRPIAVDDPELHAALARRGWLSDR